MLLVIDGAALAAGPAAGQPGDHLFFAHVDVEDLVYGLSPVLERRVEGLRLVDGAGEAVQQAPLLAVRPLQPVEEHADGQLVGDELAALDVELGLLAQLGLVADVLPEEVAGGDVGEAGRRGHGGGLGSFARAGSAQ